MASGRLTSRFMPSGSGGGQFGYPNGVAVARDVEMGNGITDILFVVERNNARVSMFSLPDRVFRGAFGSGQLSSPYGIAVNADGSELQAWITISGKVHVYRIQGRIRTRGEFEVVLLDRGDA